MKRFTRLRRLYHQLQHYTVEQQDAQVQLFNYVKPPAVQDFWLRDFIEAHHLLDGSRKTVSIFSVFGSKLMIRLNRGDVKIMVARENLHRSNWKEYDNLALDLDCIDLCLGFDYHNPDSRYMRMPLWIMWLFPPDVDYTGIWNWCRKVNDPDNASYSDRRYCTFICSHDDIGRRNIYNQFSAIGHIDCPGKFLHNCDSLKEIYEDDKLRYLRNYRFNLTPENSETDGYCTEKLFEAICAGCVPIYSGSCNNPEPEILNQEAICFVSMTGDNTVVMNRVKSLNENEEEYLEMARLPRLKSEAPDVIWNYIVALEQRLKEIL